MIERSIDEPTILDLIETGQTRYKDRERLWISTSREDAMRITYFENDDTLVIHFADKPIAREVSQDWNTHVSFASDGSVVEVVVLEARARGAFPVKQQAA